MNFFLLTEISNSLQQANKTAEQMSYKNNVIKIDL